MRCGHGGRFCRRMLVSVAACRDLDVFNVIKVWSYGLPIPSIFFK
jgi:hypothetical protein